MTQLLEPTRRPTGTPWSPRAREIIDTAFGLLDDEGAEALTMRRLGEGVGMRAPSLYKHFPDKANLEAALIEDIFFTVGDVLHAAVDNPGRRGVIRSLLAAYRTHAFEKPNRYRLATSGRLRRDLLPEGLEGWAGEPFLRAVGEPFRSQALWSFAHGMVILEIDGRYPEGSELDRTWKAGAAAFIA